MRPRISIWDLSSCPSVRPSVGLSMYPSIGPSIGQSRWFIRDPGFFSSTRKRVFSTLADGWRLEWGGRGRWGGERWWGAEKGVTKGEGRIWRLACPIRSFVLSLSIPIFHFVINSFLSATSQLIKSEIGFICLSLQPSSRRFIMPCDLPMKKKKIPCKWPCFNFINCSLNNETTIWILRFLWKRNLKQLAAEAFSVC